MVGALQTYNKKKIHDFMTKTIIEDKDVEQHKIDMK